MGAPPPLSGAASAQSWTILRVLGWTSDRFTTQGLASPRLDAEVLLAHVLGLDRIHLYMDYDKPLQQSELARYRELIRRRLAGEPVAYITGQREFWSLTLAVSRAVLIPRPETELLVEVGLALLADQAEPQVVDLGTGSGAIAIALALECPGAHLWAVDSEPAALEVAQANAATHQARITFLQGDLLTPLPQEVSPDLVLANLPYIPSEVINGLAVEVRNWEPRGALDGGPDGLQVIGRLIPLAAARLRQGAVLALEVGHDQAQTVSRLLDEHGFHDIQQHHDLGGVARVVSSRKG